MLRMLLSGRGLGVIGIGLAVVCVMFVALWDTHSHSLYEESYEESAQTVIVSRGDTLWTIARNILPEVDPRKTVFYIKKANGLESVDIAPGQVLVVPNSLF
ncbi:MAG: LysM peptidoglycan-binding domain-containing protein [Firmicutes bacterium]|mgnify:CR=1 FL=1|nr:LysM peptidoglycan-binding domain-containing protein [Bacillota bacterium]